MLGKFNGLEEANLDRTLRTIVRVLLIVSTISLLDQFQLVPI